MLLFAILFFDGNAMLPLTEKYRALAKEYEAKEDEKLASKKAKKAERKG